MTPFAANDQASTVTLLVDTEICMIAGIVWQPPPPTGPRQPAAQATVQIKDSAHSTVTDSAGRFKFRRLKPGVYTLLVQAIDGATGERLIEVPPTYDVILATKPTSVPPSMLTSNAPTAPPSPSEPAAPAPTDPVAPPPVSDEPPEESAVVQIGLSPAAQAAPKRKTSRKKGIE